MESCSICFEELNEENIATLNCSHSFCITCLNKLFDINKNICPLCRSEIKEFYNKEEKTKIIFKIIPNEIDNRVLQQYNDRYNKSRIKNYLLTILLLAQLYLLINSSYSLDDCNLLNKELYKNNTELLNNYNDQLHDRETTMGTYIYDTIKNALIYCEIPISYIKKCKLDY